MLLLTTKNVLVCDSELIANESRKTTWKIVLEPQAKTRARVEPRRGQKREITQPLTLTVPSDPILGGSTSSTDVPVNSSVTASVSVEDMVQTSVPVSSDVGIPILAQLDRCASMKAKRETLRN